MSIESIIVIIIALSVGSIGKAITGFGLPLIAIPVMASFIGVETSVVIMVIPGVLSNLWQLWEHRAHGAAIDGLGAMLVACVLGVAAGTWSLSWLDDRVLSLIMAAWIAIYLANLLYKGGLRIPRRMARILSPTVVLVTGVVQGATGASGPIFVTYLHALRLRAGVQVYIVSVIFLAFALSQLVAVAGFGLLTTERLWQSLLALIPIGLTMPIGFRIARVINRRMFDACVVVLLAATCFKLAWNGLAGG